MIKVAQLGCGYWGPNLLRNLVANKTCDIQIVCDFAQARRGFVQALYPQLTVTDNVEEVLNNKSIDAVVIATPVATHYELAMQALQAKKHIFVEKPMAQSVKEVEDIAQCAKKNNLVAMVGHTFLYNSAVRYLKNLVKSEELGDLRYIASQRLNLGRIRADVNALWNFAPHDISIIQYLLDEPKPVKILNQGMDYVQEGIDDVAFLNIVYPNKVMANIHVSWLDPRKVRRMIVVGSKKMVVYDDVADNKIHIYDKGIDRIAELGVNMDFDQPGLFKFNHREGDMVFPKINFEEPLKVEVEHFADCIQNGTECLTGPEHALNVIAILEKASQ